VCLERVIPFERLLVGAHVGDPGVEDLEVREGVAQVRLKELAVAVILADRRQYAALVGRGITDEDFLHVAAQSAARVESQVRDRSYSIGVWGEVRQLHQLASFGHDQQAVAALEATRETPEWGVGIGGIEQQQAPEPRVRQHRLQRWVGRSGRQTNRQDHVIEAEIG